MVPSLAIDKAVSYLRGGRGSQQCGKNGQEERVLSYKWAPFPEECLRGKGTYKLIYYHILSVEM